MQVQRRSEQARAAATAVVLRRKAMRTDGKSGTAPNLELSLFMVSVFLASNVVHLAVDSSSA